MKPLYSQREFDQARSTTLLPLECSVCGQQFSQSKANIQRMLSGSNKRLRNKFCSPECFGKSHNKQVSVPCDWCGKTRPKCQSQIARTKHNFCNRSCAAHFKNANKKYGTRRSKLERWIETELNRIYPQIEMQFNQHDTINSELDIYIPSLRLAFELNGIFHYEPIYGQDKLDNIQNNDARKFQACLEHQIELCIIDTSSMVYFKADKAEKYLAIVCQLIDQKRAPVQVVEP